MKVRAHGLHRVLASHATDSVEYGGGVGGRVVRLGVWC